MAGPPILRPRVINRDRTSDALPMPIPPAAAERFPIGEPAHPGDLPSFGGGTPTLWSGGTKFPDQGFEYGCALWAALAAKMAYVSTGATLNSYAEKIGATSVTKVAFDDASNQVPRGLKIVYPSMVLWVIQGTTRWEQIIPMTTNLRYRAINVAGDPAPNATGNFSWVFRPFYDVSTAWYNLLDQWLLTEEGRKPFMLIGHSLGAGVLTPLLQRLEKNQGSLWDETSIFGNETRPPDKYAALNFRGGYVFGSPKTRAQRGPDGLPTYQYRVGQDERLNPIYGQRMHWSRLTQRVLSFASPLDPICKIPDRASAYPLIMQAAVRAGLEAFGPNGNFSYHWTDYREGRVHPRSLIERVRRDNPELLQLPSNPSGILTRMGTYHFTNFYVSSLRELIAADGHGEPTSEWSDLMDWVDAQPQEDKITESFTP